MEAPELDDLLATVLPQAFEGSTIEATKAVRPPHSTTFSVRLEKSSTPHDIWTTIQKAVQTAVRCSLEHENGPDYPAAKQLAVIARIQTGKRRCQMSIRSTFETQCPSFTIVTIHAPAEMRH